MSGVDTVGAPEHLLDQAIAACEDELDAQDKALRGLMLERERFWNEPDSLSRLDADRDDRQDRRDRLQETLRHLWRIRLYLGRERNFITPPVEQLRPAYQRSKVDSINTRVRERVATLLAEAGPLHRTDLLKTLVGEGVLGRERNPMDRLASILASNAHLFRPVSRGVYSLVGVGHPEQPLGLNGSRALCDRAGQPPVASTNPRQKEHGHDAVS